MARVMENLMPIGEFATASRLSQKALRLYGEKGLLAPAWVDPDSGYRYNRPEQLKAAALIALLRRAGVPLAEIRAFLREPNVSRLAAISGPQCDFPEILGAYEWVYRWAKEHGREPAGPPREIYFNRIDEPLQMEIALPLR